MDHRARVLDLQDRDAMLAEMQSVGVAAGAVCRMTDAARWRPVRLEGVDGRVAAVIRQEMLTLGGECALHRAVAEFDAAPRPLVLLGTASSYQRLAERLAAQSPALAEVGREVLAAVEGYDLRWMEPLDCAGRTLPLGERTLVTGILNVTADSFSGDGVGGDLDATLARAAEFIGAGADILDVGGESTRPGSEAVPLEDELERVLPVIEALAGEFEVAISVDTSKPEVARLAVAAGAGMVNDVYGLRAEGMVEAVAETGAAACIMHMKGDPRTMQAAPHYDDLMTEIFGFLAERVEAGVSNGVRRSQLVVDPGFGFGKTVAHNLEILRRLRELRSLGLGVMIGTSRKSSIGKVLDVPVEERLMGTAATCAVAIANGADIIRVHDVAAMAQVARMADAIAHGWREAP